MLAQMYRSTQTRGVFWEDHTKHPPSYFLRSKIVRYFKNFVDFKQKNNNWDCFKNASQ